MGVWRRPGLGAGEDAMLSAVSPTTNRNVAMWRLGFGLPPDALRRALGWAMLLIAQARGSFAAALGAAVLLLLVRQFNVQALANLVTVLAAEHPDMTVARPDAA